MRTAIFGGSFNPFGSHHREVLKQVLAHPWADDVWVIPSFGHPLKDPRSFAPFEDRMEMVRRGVEGLPVRVLDTERQMGLEKTLTYDVLCHLYRHHPARDFKFVVGGDLRSEVSKWEKGPEVEREFGFIWLDEIQGDFVHSTKIREEVREGGSLEWLRFVPPGVGAYILERGLYR